METKTVPHLLIFAPNWLGDAVMALPAIADLRRALPDARIDVAARPSIAPLFAMASGIDEVVTLDSRRDPEAVSVIRSRDHSAALLLTNSFQTALTVWRAGVPERWGYRTDWRGPLLTRAILPAAGSLHQAAYYQHLVARLGYQNGPPEARLEVRREARLAGADLLRSAGWNEVTPLVAIAPGAAYGGAKRWPAERFAALAADLASDGVASVLVGGAADEAAGAEVLEKGSGGFFRPGVGKNPPDPFNLIGRTDLMALAGVLSYCRTLVSNDSGAMHFGAALGLPVTAIFGPTDERVTRPLGRAGHPEPVILTHDVWCRPCLLRECPLTHRCMRGIAVDTVARAIRQESVR
jgi:heptosyltransferase-2